MRRLLAFAGLVHLLGCSTELALITADPLAIPGAECELADAAFCEPFTTAWGGGRGGDLDERRWAVSRHGYLPASGLLSIRSEANATSGITLCGESFARLTPPRDIRVCGRLEEVVDDGNGFAISSMMVRQPFDFAGRVGTLVFDVEAKRDPLEFSGHGWWGEVWITSEPTPLPSTGGSTVDSRPRNGLTLRFVPRDLVTCGRDSVGGAMENEASTLALVAEGGVRQIVPTSSSCFTAREGKLNRFELKLSRDRLEVWHTDASSPVLVSSFEGLSLPFERGFVHLSHVQFQSGQYASTTTQVLRWDNVAFDGPRLPVLRASDVDDQGEILAAERARRIGYYLQASGEPRVFDFQLNPSGASQAWLNFTSMAGQGEMTVVVNGGAPIVIAAAGASDALRTFSVPVLAALRSGTNQVQFNVQAGPSPALVSNIDISLDVP
jgi:hypothetical protein